MVHPLKAGVIGFLLGQNSVQPPVTIQDNRDIRNALIEYRKMLNTISLEVKMLNGATTKTALEEEYLEGFKDGATAVKDLAVEQIQLLIDIL